MHQNGRDGAAAFIEARLDDRTFGGAVGVGTQLLHLRHQQHRLKQRVDAHAGQRRHRDADDVAAPLLGDELVFGELLFDAVGVGFRLIHLVDRHDDRDAGGFGVVDRLHRLRHDAVVRRDH